jgi:hypothetical protein
MYTPSVTNVVERTSTVPRNKIKAVDNQAGDRHHSFYSQLRGRFVGNRAYPAVRGLLLIRAAFHSIAAVSPAFSNRLN